MDNSIDQFNRYRIPTTVEDDILAVFANHINEEGDLLQDEVPSFFQELQLEQDLTSLIDVKDLLIDDTNLVDFDQLMKQTGYILIYMNNADIIDQYWTLMIKNCGKDKSMPQISNLRRQQLYVKDLQKIINVVGGQFNIIELLTVANQGKKIYISYLDFAMVLGKLGYLKY